LVREVKIRRGDEATDAPVVVALDFEVGMQDQAFLGPESGLAVPAEDGGVDLYVATQWLHVDQAQVCGALGMPPEKVRLHLAGVGGAFGGREDLSMHVHACLLALHTGKPVKMSYSREESFFGHVHRHPAWLHYEFGAQPDGTLLHATADILFDGGAYASSTGAVVGNGGTLGLGPYRIPNLRVNARGVYTHNPPCGAMRGFGCVQAAFAHEALMDELADAVGVDRVEFRARNGMREGDRNITGQLIDSAAPVAELIRAVRDMPLPGEAAPERDLRELPGGVSNTTHGEGVVRGVGYAVTYKNVGFSEGFDDYSTARVRLQMTGGEPVATVHTAAAEVGQGLVTVEQQIVRTELGVQRVVVAPKDTSVGSGGSTSASRQTYVTGGAVKAACAAVRASVLARAAARLERSGLVLDGDKSVDVGGEVLTDLAEVLGDDVVEETVEWRHRPTQAIDPETGQGDAHVQYAFSAHRAVVDVDVELGLVKVVALDTAQDVGKAINPDAVVGQIQGGSAQGMGLALMEEVLV
ncbi:MAG: molybdopterin cofactor-binding domain-containing protein, partial [Pseudonocardia sp.]